MFEPTTHGFLEEPILTVRPLGSRIAPRAGHRSGQPAWLLPVHRGNAGVGDAVTAIRRQTPNLPTPAPLRTPSRPLQALFGRLRAS